jgi:hypothetical protein
VVTALNPAAEPDDAFAAAVRALDSLRGRGAAVVDPAAMAFAASLARRGAGQDAAVRNWLAPRLAQATAELSAGVDPSPAMTGAAVPSVLPLASLRRALASDANDELKSVRRLRPALARWRVEREIAHAQAGGPENPGPLNSEHLLLRALQHLQTDAPGYLDAFVTQMDTLLWLDEAKGAGRKARSR